MTHDHENMPSMLRPYSRLRFSPGEDGEFAAHVRARAAHRRKMREVRRSAYAGLTTLLLVILTIQGARNLPFHMVSPDRDMAPLASLGYGWTTDAPGGEDLALFSRSEMNQLIEKEVGDDYSKILTLMDSDIPEDPVSGIAMYNDATVDQALQRLKASLSTDNGSATGGNRPQGT